MKVAVITQKGNDLCGLLKQFATVDVFTVKEAENVSTARHRSCAV